MRRLPKWIGLLATLLVCTPGARTQDPWPLERQDRYGTARAVIGPDPATLTTPWISHRLASGFPVSHGASIRADGMGFFGDWVDNKLFKFDTRTGAILGAFQALDFVACVPAIGPNNMLVCSTDSPNAKLFGIDSNVMDFMWFKQTSYVAGSPNIGPEGDTVFAIDNGGVFRLQVGNGAQVWARTLNKPNGTVVFTRDNNLVIVSNGTFLTALDWSNGQTVWNVNYGTTMGRPGVAPNGTIVVGSVSGSVYGISPATGTVLWSFTTLDKAQGAPAFSPDGTVAYVPSVDFRVYALRVADGARLWSFTTSLWCEHGPVVDTAGRIYVHNKAGDLYCISPAGAQIWKVRLNGESRGPMTIGPDGTLYVGYTGGPSALAVIRQYGLSLFPNSLAMERGTLKSGDVPQILTSDDDRAVFAKSFIVNSVERPIRAVVTANSQYKPAASIKVTLESRANTVGLTRWLDLWNNQTGSWDPLAASSEGLNDSVMTATMQNAGPYMDTNGTVRLRVSWKDTGIVQFANWETSIDQVHFEVVPQFVP